MEMQLKKVTKEEAHKMVDEVEGDTIFVLTYDKNIGLSDNGRHIKKKKGKLMVNQSDLIILSEEEPVRTLSLYNNRHRFFDIFKRENIIKSIILPKLEWYSKTYVLKNILTKKNKRSII